ncbi:hypothetical protein BTUL_0047g00060 [Botrytis tulipae]|uniref:cellulase n=1 Tax=Botrytis tulipae TaxID=87230 RepID=A0A4Z1ER12_9HELO|nr:hypothetical protein BTUL_0047g00060 [Botrytis tulipae]
MRFTNFVLAAGLTATAFAAPVVVKNEDDSCVADYDETTSAAVVAQTTLPSSSAAVVASSAASPVVASSSAVSSAAAVATPASSSPAAPHSPAVATSSKATAGKLQWIGASESAAEFGETHLPGVFGTDYKFPNTTAIQTLIDGGMNIFRVPFRLERMAQGSITADLDATYLAGYKEVIDYITAAGASAVMEPHNSGRYDSVIITSTSDFGNFWGKLAAKFADNSKVIFDCNNEFHDEPTATIYAELNQACVTAIRGAGAKSQYIFVEGTAYTGAWTWVSSGNSVSMLNITDPEDKLVYEFHQYLDADGSGTSATCVSGTIGAERIADATAWLKTNNLKGVIGEFAGGVNADCESAISGMLDALAADNQYWLGALWWGAGPMWGDYIYAFEPPTGAAYIQYFKTIVKYVA